MIDYVQQAEQEQQEKVNRLYPKKWHKFVRPWYTSGDGRISPIDILIIIVILSLMENHESLESQRNKDAV